MGCATILWDRKMRGHRPGRTKMGPPRGPQCCKQERSERLSGGLLCDRSAELERPVFFAAARYQSDNGAKERHGCDFLGHGDPHHCHGGGKYYLPFGVPPRHDRCQGPFCLCAGAQRPRCISAVIAVGTTGHAAVPPNAAKMINPHCDATGRMADQI